MAGERLGCDAAAADAADAATDAADAATDAADAATDAAADANATPAPAGVGGAVRSNCAPSSTTPGGLPANSARESVPSDDTARQVTIDGRTFDGCDERLARTNDSAVVVQLTPLFGSRQQGVPVHAAQRKSCTHAGCVSASPRAGRWRAGHTDVEEHVNAAVIGVRLLRAVHDRNRNCGGRAVQTAADFVFDKPHEVLHRIGELTLGVEQRVEVQRTLWLPERRRDERRVRRDATRGARRCSALLPPHQRVLLLFAHDHERCPVRGLGQVDGDEDDRRCEQLNVAVERAHGFAGHSVHRKPICHIAVNARDRHRCHHRDVGAVAVRRHRLCVQHFDREIDDLVAQVHGDRRFVAVCDQPTEHFLAPQSGRNGNTSRARAATYCR